MTIPLPSSAEAERGVRYVQGDVPPAATPSNIRVGYRDDRVTLAVEGTEFVFPPEVAADIGSGLVKVAEALGAPAKAPVRRVDLIGFRWPR